jgi:uncharacterized OB-fold protein
MSKVIVEIYDDYDYDHAVIKSMKKYEEPKTGRWIDGKCNRCGTHAPFWAMASTYYLSEYCPHCGAKMTESEELNADSN